METTVSRNTPRLVTRLLASIALVTMYLFGTLAATGAAMTFGATSA